MAMFVRAANQFSRLFKETKIHVCAEKNGNNTRKHKNDEQVLF